MTNLDYVQRTIDIFEDSLSSSQPLVTVEDIALRIGYSSHHLGRLFSALCDMSLGHYMQKRRLSEALRRIADGGLSAARISQDLGWADYSSFARALRKEFGISPGRLKEGIPERLDLTNRARPHPACCLGPDEEPCLIRPAPFHISGMVFYMGPDEKSFHRPWRIFSAAMDRIVSRLGQASYQVSSWIEGASALDQGLCIHCGVETQAEAAQEPFFFSKTIDPGSILRFVHRGPIEAIGETYRRIWQVYLPGSSFKLKGSWEYQRYPDASCVEICLPVEEACRER